MRNLRGVAFALLPLFACSSEVGPDNPYDPSNPGPKKPGRIAGEVYVVGAATQGGFAIHIRDAAGSPVDGGLRSEDDGSFVSPPLEPGVFSLELDVPLGNAPVGIGGIAVAPGLTTQVGLLTSAVAPPIHAIVGSLSLEDSVESPAGTRIVAIRSSGTLAQSYTTFADAAGAYSFGELGAGHYELFADREGFTPDRQSVDLGAGTRDVATAAPMRLYPASAVMRFSGAGEVLGTPYTQSRGGTTVPDGTVTLALLAFGGVNEMRFSESADFDEGGAPVPWRDYVAEVPVILSVGEGEKTMYGQFRVMETVGAEQIERLRTEVYHTRILYDATAPTPIAVALAPDERVAADGVRYLTGDPTSVPVTIEAFDAHSRVAGIKLVVGDVDPSLVGYQAIIAGGTSVFYPASVDLGSADGLKTVDVYLIDNAGNESTAVRRSLVIDHSPPVEGIVLVTGVDRDGASPSLTRSPAVTVTLAGFADTAFGSGLTDYAVSEDPTFADAAWRPCPEAGCNLTMPWTLSPGGLQKTVYARVRDAAGNPSDAASASIDLDVTAPAAGVLVLAGGLGITADPVVSFGLTTGESGLRVTLYGPILEEGTYALDALPATVTLVGDDGAQLLSAYLTDAAGNASPTFYAVLELDTSAPGDGAVRLADGLQTVHSRSIAVSIADTNPDRMALWEVAPLAACDAPACGDSRFVAFAPATTFTLSEGQGDKQICWRFCDRAGNGSMVGSATVQLGAYVPRPTPVLERLSPTNVFAFSTEPNEVVVTGRGIAADTQAQVGDFLLPCVGGASACSADSDGSCGTVCESSCATSCTITVPEAVMRLAGAYVTRLVTPAPVASGLGTSAETRVLSVVAPLPTLSVISPRGLTQAVDSFGNPIAQEVTVQLWGRHLMDNAQFRLGQNYGRVTTFADDPLDEAGRFVEVIVSTAGLEPSDLDDYALTAVNPSPGGGERPMAFGINPVAAACPPGAPCVSNLRRTRTRLPSGDGVAQAFAPEAKGRAGLRWQGGDAAVVRGNDGQVLARLSADAAGGIVPLPTATWGSVTLEDRRGVAPNVVLGAATTRGSRVFAPPQSWTLPNDIAGLTVGDFDRDGHQDVAMTTATNEVEVRLATGAYDLGPAVRFATGSAPNALEALDVNQDGVLDLVVASGYPSATFALAAAVHLGLGDGTFAPRIDFDVGGQTYCLAAGDFDHDGDADLVFGLLSYGAVAVLLGDGNGRFSSPTRFELGAGAAVPAYPTDIAVSDIDGDGHLDLAVTDRDNDRLVLLRGAGDGTFTAGGTLATGRQPNSVRLADLDHDGAPDVVVGHDSATYVSVWRNGGDGSFTARPNLGSDAGHPELALGDVDGDGLVDILAYSHLGSLQLFTGRGDMTFATPTSLGAAGGAYDMRLADLDEDGDLDVLVRNTALSAYFGSGGRALGSVVEHALGRAPMRVAVADVDRDGYLDLVGQNGDGLLVQLGTGGGAFVNAQVVDFVYSQPVLGDLDADGDLDLVTHGGQSVEVRLGVGDGTFGASSTFTMSADFTHLVTVLALGDLNGDQDLDLIAAIGCTGTDCSPLLSGALGVRLGAAGASFGPLVTYENGRYAGALALGDLDGDGALDVVTAHDIFADDAVFIRLGNGDGTLGAIDSYPLGFRPTMSGPMLALADFDEDGIVDVAVGEPTSPTGSIIVALGNGDGTLGATTYTSIGGGGAALVAADFNGDESIDLASLNGMDGSVSLRLGRGDGTFENAGELVLPGSGFMMAVADVDGNGAADLLAPSFQADTLAMVLMPASGRWAQSFTAMPAPALAVGGGLTRSVHQAKQYVSSIAVRVRVTGENLGALTLSLAPPNGDDAVVLGTGPGSAGVWQVSYPTTATTGDLSTLLGWQPAGNWTLTVTNAGGAVAQLEDFAVLTRGAFSRRQLVYNPGFEQGLAGFTPPASGGLRTVPAHAGARSLLVMGGAEASTVIPGPFAAGTRVTAVAYVSAAAGALGARIDVAGDTWSDTYGSTPLPAPSVWTQRRVDLVLPADTSALTLRLLGGAAGTQAFFDDLALFVD